MNTHPIQELRESMREVQEARATIIGWFAKNSTLEVELTLGPLVAELSSKSDWLCRLLEEVIPVNRAMLDRVIQGAAVIAACEEGPAEDLRDAVKHYCSAVRELQPLPAAAEELNRERLPVAYVRPRPGQPFRPITCAADLPSPGDPLVR